MEAQAVGPVHMAGAGNAAQGISMGDQQVRIMNIGDLDALLKSHSNFLLVDARSLEQYAMAHIPGAVSIPLDQIPQYASSIDRDRLIVTYCGNYHCPISTRAAMEFTRLGFTNVRDYKGGIKEWQETGYATATGVG